MTTKAAKTTTQESQLHPDKKALNVGDVVTLPPSRHYEGTSGIVASQVYPDPFDSVPICLVHMPDGGPAIVFAVSDLQPVAYTFTLTFPRGEIAILEVRGADSHEQARAAAHHALPKSCYDVTDGDQTRGHAEYFYLWWSQEHAIRDALVELMTRGFEDVTELVKPYYKEGYGYLCTLQAPDGLPVYCEAVEELLKTLDIARTHYPIGTPQYQKPIQYDGYQDGEEAQP